MSSAIFEIKGKVALVTGGAGGIGLATVKELLKNGARGVTIADISEELGKKVLDEIRDEFGANRAVFVKTDVSDKAQLEEAFKKTISEFKNVDILINNAGTMNENDWEKTISINMKGIINGALLALEEYIPKYRSGSEGVIVNLSSIGGVDPLFVMPVYCGTKFAIRGMTQAWGHQANYDNTKIKVIAICPGSTDTPLARSVSGDNLRPQHVEPFAQARAAGVWVSQSPEYLAEVLVKIIEKAKTGTSWVVEGGQPPYQYIAPDKLECVKNTL